MPKVTLPAKAKTNSLAEQLEDVLTILTDIKSKTIALDTKLTTVSSKVDSIDSKVPSKT